MKNYFNPNWLLSRLLEKLGIKTYLERTEFAAHVFAGTTFTLLSVWTMIGWVIWTLIDEFVMDGWKGKDTLIDLSSKLLGPVIWVAYKCSQI